jgi:hypothetical protein
MVALWRRGPNTRTKNKYSLDITINDATSKPPAPAQPKQFTWDSLSPQTRALLNTPEARATFLGDAALHLARKPNDVIGASTGNPKDWSRQGADPQREDRDRKLLRRGKSPWARQRDLETPATEAGKELGKRAAEAARHFWTGSDMMNRDDDRRWDYKNTGDPTNVNFQDKPWQRALERQSVATPRYSTGEPAYSAKLDRDLPGNESERRAAGSPDYHQRMRDPPSDLPRGVGRVSEVARNVPVEGMTFSGLRRNDKPVSTQMTNGGQTRRQPIFETPEPKLDPFRVTQSQLAEDRNHAALLDINRLNKHVAVRDAARAAGNRDELIGKQEKWIESDAGLTAGATSKPPRTMTRDQAIQERINWENQRLRELEDRGVNRWDALNIINRAREELRRK